MTKGMIKTDGLLKLCPGALHRAEIQCQNRGDGSRWGHRQFPGCNEQEAKDTALSARMLVGEMVAESGRPLLSASVFFMRKYGLLLWMRREEGDHCFKEKETKGSMSPSLEHTSGEHWECRASIPGSDSGGGTDAAGWGPHTEDQWVRNLSGCLELSGGELAMSEKRGTS